MYAVVETGGKQYRVQEGDAIQVEKLAVNEGEVVSLDVIALGKDGKVFEENKDTDNHIQN